MKYKYPRTKHLYWSKGITEDDIVTNQSKTFDGKNVIVLEKMDGENTTIGNNYVHARSLDSNNHVSRNWVKNYASSFQYSLDEDMRICGENMYAVHSITYDNLLSYFYGFSVWKKDMCLSWDNTLKIFNKYDIIHPTVLYEGLYDENALINLANSLDSDKIEGYVIRNIDSFKYKDFGDNVLKYVRANHVKSKDHWMHQMINVNELN